MVDCAPNPENCGGTGGCRGSTNELAMDYIAKSGGMVLESSYPYRARDQTCQDAGMPRAVLIDDYHVIPLND